MFYSPITSIIRIFNEINDLIEIQNGGSKMAAISMLKPVLKLQRELPKPPSRSQKVQKSPV